MISQAPLYAVDRDGPPPPFDLRPPSPPLQQERTGFLPALKALLSLIVVALFIITFSVQPFRIPSASMEPTLQVGDFLLVDKQAPDAARILPTRPIRRGDVIVFHFPLEPSLHLVKRVVGLPGDRIRLRDGHVLLNGHPLAEPYAAYTPSRPDLFRDDFPLSQSADPAVDSAWWVRLHTLLENGNLIVPERSFFVLGDNRNDSEDSRYWGFVPAEAVVGRPLLIYFSLPVPGAGDLSAATSRVDRPDTADPADSSLRSFARWNRTLRVIR